MGGHRCVYTSVTRRGPAPVGSRDGDPDFDGIVKTFFGSDNPTAAPGIEDYDQVPLTGVPRKKRPLRRIAAMVLVLIAAAVVVLGVVRVPTSAVVGTQITVCGTTFGVSLVDDGHVILMGLSDAPLAAGDKARVNALCAVEVIEIERTNHDPEAIGGVARVDLKWGPW